VRYIACFDAYPEIAKLGYRSRAVRRACAEIAGLVGEESLERYHRALLVSLLIRAPEALRGRNQPEEINLLYGENYHQRRTLILGRSGSEGAGQSIYESPTSAAFTVCGLKDLCGIVQLFLPLLQRTINTAFTPSREQF
jgi:hypothetical protein